MSEIEALSGFNFRTVIDTVTTALFILDEDARILDANTSAAKLVNKKDDIILKRLCGDALDCIHAGEGPDGCGTTDFCPDCVVRSSVVDSCQGKTIIRKRADFQVQKQNKPARCVFLISASPLIHQGTPLSILSMEDITEVMFLKELIPICAECKKVRKDDDYWETIEHYLNRQYGAKMSHGICPDCIRKLYPDIKKTDICATRQKD